MSTFSRSGNVPGRCRECGRVEGEHVWKCDKCSLPCALSPDGKPELHPHGRGAILYCPKVFS